MRDQLRYAANAGGDFLVGRPDVNASVVLNGFWRSGTTWAQDLLCTALGAKSLFEPFEPGLPHHRRFIARYAERHGLSPDRRLVACLMPADTDAGPGNVWDFWERLLRGTERNTGLLRNRKGPLEGLRRGVVVKCVRAHFLLQGIHSRWGLKIIHLRRHPCDVVESICQRPGWNQNAFENLLLKNLLCGPDKPAGLLDREDRGVILDLDQNGSPVEKIAAYWAVTEKAARQAAIRMAGNAVMIDYEGLKADPATTIRRTLDHLGMPTPAGLSRETTNRPSMTAHGDVRRIPLSGDARQSVFAVLDRLGMKGDSPA